MAKKKAKKNGAKANGQSKGKSKGKTKSEAKREAKSEAKIEKQVSAESAGGPPMPAFKHVAKKKLSTGKGATPAEIGSSLVTLFNQGKTEEVERLWHHKNIESIEGDGSVFLGRKGVAEKNAWWYSTFEMHSAHAEGPFVGASGFAVHFTMEVSPRAGGDRMKSTEVGVYTVSKGKIVREEFMGTCGG
jgi:hypothetical protein